MFLQGPDWHLLQLPPLPYCWLQLWRFAHITKADPVQSLLNFGKYLTRIALKCSLCLPYLDIVLHHHLLFASVFVLLSFLFWLFVVTWSFPSFFHGRGSLFEVRVGRLTSLLFEFVIVVNNKERKAVHHQKLVINVRFLVSVVFLDQMWTDWNDIFFVFIRYFIKYKKLWNKHVYTGCSLGICTVTQI